MSFFVQRNERDKITSPSSKEDNEAKSLIHELWDWIKAILVALLVVILVHQFGFNLSTVRGSSMQPTLQEGEWLFVNRAITYLKAPQRGDVVILKEPEEQFAANHPFLVKRVVALAGDEIEARSGTLYINGDLADERYTDTPILDGDFGPVRIEQGHVFVMGDNRHAAASADSRRFGAIPASLIQGRAECVLWPLSMIANL